MIKTLIPLLFLAASPLLAQSQEDFDTYGTELFEMITDPDHPDAPQFIRISEYLRIIAEQPVGDNRKLIMEREMNEGYTSLYERWARSMDEIKETYNRETEEGAGFEYLKTRFEPKEGTEHIYSVQTDFIYRKGQVQNMVSWHYDLGWLPGYGEFRMMSPLREDF